MVITKDDDKGDDKKLKDQSKNNSSESRIIQDFKIRIKNKSQESRFKVQDLQNQDQDSRFKNQEKA
ncbi:hypothetical protein HKD37_12G034071 [Glycine soja]